MANDNTLWPRIMKAALAIPGVAVDRTSYLRGALKEDLAPKAVEQAVNERPPVVADYPTLTAIASGAITYHTATVTTLSTITGLPGGPALLASIPADLAQYYYHVFVLAQKMAYLYGFPDLRDENGRLTEDATDLLTLFVGIMMGAKLADDAVRDISRDLALQIAKKMPQKMLTRTIYYPVVRQVAKRIGIDLSRSSFTKTFGRFIPLLGGLVSGSVTYVTFHRGALRLQKALSRQADLLGTDAPDTTTAPDTTPVEDRMSLTALRVLVNMALLEGEPSRKKREYVLDKIGRAHLPADEKAQLKTALDEQQTFKVDISEFAGDAVSSTLLVRMLAETILLGGHPGMGEKIYFNKIARELGYTKSDIGEFADGAL